MYVEYDSNNSGGSWWLSDQNWKDLEAAGWIVAWKSLEHLFNDDGGYVRESNGVPKLVSVGNGNAKYGIGGGHPDEKGEYRWLGALAEEAYKPDCGDLKQAVREWEEITGCCSTDAGCPCCGSPHSFTLYDEIGKRLDGGPHAEYVCSW